MKCFRPRFGKYGYSILAFFTLVFLAQGCSTLHRDSLARSGGNGAHMGQYSPEFASAGMDTDNNSRKSSEALNEESGEEPIKVRSSATSRNLFKAPEKTRSVGLGMGMHHVRNMWGLPDKVQTAGNNARNGHVHERWVYFPTLYEPVTRVIYFEAGRVTGWERQ